MSPGFVSLPYPASNKNCGTCVVLPDPVAPTITTISFSVIFSTITWTDRLNYVKIDITTKYLNNQATASLPFKNIETK